MSVQDERSLDSPETASLLSEDPSPDNPRRDLSSWKEAIRWVVVTRVLFFAVAAAAANFLASGESEVAPSFETLWSRWDASLFFLVAEHGYTGPTTDPHASAFFPLFPMLVKAVAATGVSYVVAGLLINSVACVVAFAHLHRWAEEELGEGSGRRAITYLAFFPTAVFLVAPYSEAIFLAGAIPAFRFARQGRWGLAALPAAIATGARFAGLFVVVGLFFEFLRQRDLTPRRFLTAGAALAAGIAPALIYFAYLAAVKGSFMQYFIDQRTGWHRELTPPWLSFQRTWDTFRDGAYAPNWIIAWRLEIVAVVIGLAFVVWSLARKEWGFAAYMGTFLATLMMSTWYFSIPRMMVGFFPIALLVAGYTRREPRQHEPVLVTLVGLAIMGTIVYTQGSWFY